MVPKFVNNAADFAKVVQLGVSAESIVLEFKHSIPTKKEDAQLEMCRDIAQMANTDGGCLVMGVNEKTEGDRKVASEIVPVSNPDGLKQWITQAIKNHMVPSTLNPPIEIIQTEKGNVVVVNVAQSRHTVAVWHGHCLEYWRRNSHGKVAMTHPELERHIMDGSRATRIAIEKLRVPADAPVQLAGGYWIRRQPSDKAEPLSNCSSVIAEVKDGWFVLSTITSEPVKGKQLQPHPLAVPYEVVRAVWGEGAINLLLSVRVVLVRTAFHLEPYERGL